MHQTSAGYKISKAKMLQKFDINLKELADKHLFTNRKNK